MSKHWDLRCQICDVSCGFHVNHGSDYLLDVWELREVWASLAPHEEKLNALSFEPHFIWDFNGGVRSLPEFAAAHKNHPVKPYNEYGEYLDEGGVP